MVFIVLDLEWNGAPLYKTGGYFNEIIEFGAVKLNDSLEITDSFQALVKPTVHKKLTGRVKRLTHISNDALRAEKNFVQTFKQFREWVGGEENCFMTWGTGDILVLIENLERYGLPGVPDLADNYCDAQELCQRKLGIERSQQPGLSAVAEMIGLTCEEMEMHRALDDSRVSAVCLKRLWDDGLFRQLLYKADDEFIRRLTFKTVFLSDIENPLIKPEMFVHDCPACGTPMTLEGEIVPRNRSFSATYYCPTCDRRLIGRHQFKLKYDGLEPKCSFREPAPEVSEPLTDADEPVGSDPAETA